MMYIRKKKKSTYTQQNKVKLVQGGKEYFDLLIQLIGQAEQSIHLQSYIYDDDETGKMVAEALKSAALREVKVYVMADGYASQDLSKTFIDQLITSGIQFRYFEPIFKSRTYYFGRRLHQKIFVADAKVALVGGINISNRYNDMPGKPAWHDYALYVEGEISGQLCDHCWKTWNGFQVKTGTTPCEKVSFQFNKNETSIVGMRRNDWVRRKNEVSLTYAEMFRNADSHITIMCSYFLPGKFIRRLLSNAAKRGVTIKVITAGPSDVMIAKRAERWLYDWLLRHNIRLFEYQPTVLHAKVAVCDGKWFTIGSYNINDISAYASIELNLDVYDAKLATDLQQQFEIIISNDCKEISSKEFQKEKNIFLQFGRWFSYHFIRFVFYALTFYFKRKSPE